MTAFLESAVYITQQNTSTEFKAREDSIDYFVKNPTLLSFLYIQYPTVFVTNMESRYLLTHCHIVHQTDPPPPAPLLEGVVCSS